MSIFDDLLGQAPAAKPTPAPAKPTGTVYGPGGHVASPWSLEGITSTLQDAGNQVMGGLNSAVNWVRGKLPSPPTTGAKAFMQAQPSNWLGTYRGAINNAAGNVPTAIQGIQQARSLPDVLKQAQQSSTGR